MRRRNDKKKWEVKIIEKKWEQMRRINGQFSNYHTFYLKINLLVFYRIIHGHMGVGLYSTSLFLLPKQWEMAKYKCIVQYCTVLYHAVLYYNALYCSVLQYTVLYFTVLYCTVMYCTEMYCNVFYCTVMYCNLMYCTLLYCTVLYCNI